MIPAPGDGQVYEIPLDRIEPDPDNVRSAVDPAVADLAANIQQNGLLQAIIIYPVGREGHYRISGGHRRFQACTDLGWATIPATAIETPATTLKRLDLMAAENLQRKQLDPIERALLYKRYLDRGLQQKDVAARLNVSASLISSELRLLDLPVEIQEQLKRREIPYAKAVKLAVRERNAKAERPHGTFGRRRTSGLAAPHFNSHHSLSEKARDLCLASAHPTYLHIWQACGPCWETVIRLDALSDSPQAVPSPPPRIRRFADPGEIFTLIRCERCGVPALERGKGCYVVVSDGTSTRRRHAPSHSFPVPIQGAETPDDRRDSGAAS